MEGILGYIMFVLKRILWIVRIFALFIFHDLKKFPPAPLFHPASLLDSMESTKGLQGFLRVLRRSESLKGPGLVLGIWNCGCLLFYRRELVGAN